MQFEMNYNTKNDFVSVDFTKAKFNADTWGSLINSFSRIGGNCSVLAHWKFPKFITSETISTIIQNTCFVCGGLMEDSTAYDNSWVSHNDFGNDAGETGSTMSKSGPARMIKVRKCIACGHSHT